MGFDELDDIDPEDLDTDGNVDTPTEEEIEELSMVELREKYGVFADLYGLDEGEDHRS